MRTRCLAIIAVAAICGLWLLALRQQRIALVHNMSDLRRQLDTTRADLWRARADVAALVAPPRLPSTEGQAWAPATTPDEGQRAEPEP